MQLIVLSAGKGSRLPTKFRKKPKCMVEINSQPLLLYNKVFFSQFKDKIIVAGYKHKFLKKISEKIGFKNIINKEYSTTNMVYSLFLTRRFVKQDVVVVYGDIVFDEKIKTLLKNDADVLPVNSNWLKNWKKRMSFKKLIKDAENLILKDDKLIEIGTKIDKKKLPKYQFMGIIKLKKKTFFRCYDFFKKLKNKKIDMTTFINLCVKNKITSFKIQKYDGYWYEIDTNSDYKLAKRELI